jgi:hypothetical protein
MTWCAVFRKLQVFAPNYKLQRTVKRGGRTVRAMEQSVRPQTEMSREIRILAEHPSGNRSLAWVSVRDDGAVSVGLSDRFFQAPALSSSVEVAGAIHAQSIDLAARHGHEAIVNPHFTFHPLAYYHLRADNQPELFSGLLMVDLVLADEGRLPWVRAISRTVSSLKQFEPPSRRALEYVRLPISTGECSVELLFDFVGSSASSNGKRLLIDCGGRRLEITARQIEAQTPTLWWNHEC